MYEQSEDDKPDAWTMKHDILLFDWLEKKRNKEAFKRRNPGMQTAENKKEVIYIEE